VDAFFEAAEARGMRVVAGPHLHGPRHCAPGPAGHRAVRP
jgi:hypothetical protein